MSDVASAAALLLLFLGAGSGVAETASAPGAATVAGCPVPRMNPPKYPVEEVRRKRSGKVTLLVRGDACGRVVEARVAESSGRKALDDAVLKAARDWVLAPDSEAPVPDTDDGWQRLTTVFAVDPNGFTPVDWPETHARARFELAGPRPVTAPWRKRATPCVKRIPGCCGLRF